VPTQTSGNAYSIEVDPSGKIVYSTIANAILYRTFRLSSIYSNY